MRKFLKWSAIIGVLLLTIPFVALTIGTLLIDDAMILSKLDELIEKQTGGRFDAQSLKINLLGEISLHDVKFFSPTDTVGFSNGGGVVAEPDVSFRELQIRYNPWALLTWKIHISNVELLGPTVSYSHEQDPVVAISAYRSQHYPTTEDQAEPASEQTSIPDMLAALSVPVRIELTNLGFSDFNLLAKLKGAAPIVVNNLNLNIGASAFASSADLRVRLHGKRISVTPHALSNPDFTTEMSLQVHPRSDSITLKRSIIKFMDLLSVKTSGTITFAKDDKIKYDLKHQTHIDLNKMDALAQLVPNLPTLLGTVDLDVATLSGEFDAMVPPVQQIPDAIAIALKLHDVSAHLPAENVYVNGLTSDLTITKAKDVADVAAQVKLLINSVVANNPNPQVAAVQAGNIDLNLNTRADVSQRNGDIEAKFAIGSALAVTSDGDKIETSLQLSSNGKTNGPSGSLSIDSELKDLARAHIDVSCEAECRDVSINKAVAVNSFAEVYAFTRPLVQKFVMLQYLPDSVKGALTIAGQGKITSDTNPLETAKFLESAKVNATANVNLLDFHASLPKIKTAVGGLNLMVGVEADTRNARISLEQNFATLLLPLKGKQRNQDQAIQINRQSLATKLNAKLGAGNTFAAAARKASVKLLSTIKVAEVNVPGVLPQPVRDLQLVLDSSVLRGERIKLEELSVLVPDLGVRAIMDGTAAMDAAGRPSNLLAELRVDTDQSLLGKMDSSFATTGQVALESEFKSADFQDLTIEGKLSLNDFSLGVGAEDPNKTLFVVQAADGIVPFSQTISLKEPAPVAKILNDAAADKNVLTNPTDDELQASINDYEVKNADLMRGKLSKITLSDYGNVRPFQLSNQPISISYLSFKDLEFSNIELDINIAQNVFALNNYMLEFLGGKIQGSVQLVFAKKPVGLRSALHITGLNTRKLLDRLPKAKRRARQFMFDSSPYLDATAHIDYDILYQDILGGIELTSIGKEQLRTVLYFLDPDDKNKTISDIKRALYFGDVKLVKIPINNGLIGLEVDLRLLSAPIPTPKLQRFPLATLVENFMKQSNDQQTTDDTTVH